MSNNTFLFSIVSTEKKIFEGNIKFLQVNGINGEFGIMPNHTPFLTEIIAGPIIIHKEDSSEDCIYVEGGFIEVADNQAIIIADSVTRAEDIDEQRIKETQEKIKQDLESLKNKEDKKEFATAYAALNQTKEQIRSLQLLKKIKNKVR